MASYLEKRKAQIRPVMDKLASLKTAIAEEGTKFEGTSLASKDAAKQLTALKLSIDELEKALDSGVVSVDEFILIALKSVDEWLLLVHECDQTVRDYLMTIKGLDDRIQERYEDLKKVLDHQEAVKKEMSMEDKRLNDMRNDLRIYKGRLEREWIKVFPNVPIVLP